MSRPWTDTLAWSLCALSLALVLGGFVLSLFIRSLDASFELTAGLLLLPAQIAWPTVGALIARRHPAHPVGWLFCGYGLGMGLALFADPYGRYALLAPASPLPAGWFMLWLAPRGGEVALTCVALALLLFPTGRLPSPRWRPLVWLVLGASGLFAAGEAFQPGPVTQGVAYDNPLGITDAAAFIASLRAIGSTAYLLGLAAAGVSLFVRLRRARGVERQQLKWITFAAAVLATAYGVGAALETIRPRPQIAGAFLVAVLLSLSLIPLAAGVAILRYRLYDIDVVIRRTLIYGALTVALGASYWAAVILLQQMLRPFVQGSELAVIGSTLAVAGLFSPARRRIQNVVDRRFYRRKYDTQRTLEQFSARLRQEVDLDRLAAEVVVVARDAVQPARASLWLRPPEHRPRPLRP
jgi:hypothetical protein